MKITPEQLNRFADAQRYYEQLGYENLEVPWFISREATNSTIPFGSSPIFTLFGDLPGSGEQSFLQMLLDGKFSTGKYQTITPCFRDEPVIDHLHRRAFLKLELIDLTESRCSGVMLKEAQGFYERYISTKVKVNWDGYDLTTDEGLELGSYGIRWYKDFHWVYGTGLAEPRFSCALEQYDKKPCDFLWYKQGIEKTSKD
jgi:hypothetical protein